MVFLRWQARENEPWQETKDEKKGGYTDTFGDEKKDEKGKYTRRKSFI